MSALIVYDMIHKPRGTQHRAEYNNVISHKGNWGNGFIESDRKLRKTKIKQK